METWFYFFEQHIGHAVIIMEMNKQTPYSQELSLNYLERNCWINSWKLLMSYIQLLNMAPNFILKKLKAENLIYFNIFQLALTIVLIDLSCH